MKLVLRVHAVRRMFQRDIRLQDIRRVVESGETIEEYPDDEPYPSRLIVVTVYEPEAAQWDTDFRRRRKP